IDEAEESQQEVLRILKALPQDEPDYGPIVLQAHLNYGFFLWSIGRMKDAEDASGRAIAAGEELVVKFKHLPEYRKHLASAHANRGTILLQSGRTKEGALEFEVAHKLFAQLVADFPEVPEYHSDLAGTLNNLGVFVKEWTAPHEARS